jgi:hypothetical protein
MWIRADSKIKVKLTPFVGIALAATFWILFYLSYPYRKLIDDGRFEAILENKTSFVGLDQVSRPIHHMLLYVQGALFQPSLEKAMWLSFLFHLGMGILVLNLVLPALHKKMDFRVILSWLALMLHPVSLQTAVHVGQRSEILGALSLVGFFVVFLRDRNLWLLFLFVITALLCKESYSFIPLVLFSFQVLKEKRKEGYALLVGAVLIFGVGIKLNAFSSSMIHSQENYRKMGEYFHSYQMGQEISPENSSILAIRNFSQNLHLQVSLVPRIFKILVFPFSLVKDYGYFPFGKDTFSLKLPWFWIGILLLLSLGFGCVCYRKRFKLEQWILILSPGIFYSVYWIFPVYDPLVLYRLYGVVFLFYTFTFPILVSRFPGTRELFLVFSLASIAAGLVRAWEMKNYVRETSLELARQPQSYRLHIDSLHAKVDLNPMSVDCEKVLEPILGLVPSTALVEIEWAWCLHKQGRWIEARTHAIKSLEQESVPENIHLALQYLTEGQAKPVELHTVHPSNIPHLLSR